MLKTIVSFLIIVGFNVAFANTTFESQAKFMCETALNLKTFAYAEHFAEDFQKQIPEPYFLQITSDLASAVGVCANYSFVKAEAPYETYRFTSATGRYAELKLSANTAGNIDGLLIDKVIFPDVVVDTIDQLNSQLSQLDVQAAVTIEGFDAQNKKFQYNAAAAQPLGSIFKLYVLGALADSVSRGTHTWDELSPIKDEWKSLPSGVMQTYSSGQSVSLKDYAEFMIKISDNTATDHLIHILGRSVVEDQLVPMGNDYPERNKPFLTTAEMFKIKWAAPVTLIDSYIQGDHSSKQNYVEKDIAAIPFDAIGTNGVSMSSPAYIHQIEWFASTNSICKAHKYLKEQNSPEVFAALSQNVPSVEVGPTSHWKYGGYKGGSEPGVLTMSYLLQTQSGKWGCVSVALNSEQKDIIIWQATDLVAKIIKLAETIIE